MDTRQLRNFLKILELGSISRAAEALGLAQPSLSQQLLRLEDEVGFKLLARTSRGVLATEAGLILQEHARQMLDQADQALEAMRRAGEEARSQVILAMPSSVGRLLTVPLTEAAMEAKPKVSLRLREAPSRAVRGMLLDGGADLGLLYDVEPLGEFVVRRLAQEDVQLVGPPGRLGGRGGGARTLREVSDLPLILPGPAHSLRILLEQEARRLGVRLKVVSEIDALEHIVGLVADGRGYSILPLLAVDAELRRGAVSAAPIDGVLGRTLCLARRPDPAGSEATRRVESLVVELLGGLMEKGRWLANPQAQPS